MISIQVLGMESTRCPGILCDPLPLGRGQSNWNGCPDKISSSLTVSNNSYLMKNSKFKY